MVSQDLDVLYRPSMRMFRPLYLFRNYIDCICHVSRAAGALRGTWGSWFSLVSTIHIFSLISSLTCVGEFRCALSKDHPFLYNSELGGGGSIFPCAILGVRWEIVVLALLMCSAISWCVL